MSALPLEREHEAWIIGQAEDLLRRMGVAYTVAAVSPWDEKSWPADEEMGFGGKIVGLQFKRAYPKRFSSGPTVARWTLRSPPGQLQQVKRTPEIYYVLPTFVEREMRGAALASCFVWRPPKKHRKIDFDYYWIRDQAFGFGEFLRRVLGCQIGQHVPGHASAASVIRTMMASLSGRALAEGADAPVPQRREIDLPAYDEREQPDVVQMMWFSELGRARSVG